MKYLVVGLGNIGKEYNNTRHNIGFQILDNIAKSADISFLDKRYAFISKYTFKGRTFVLLKPSTFVNLSGKAVNYWLKKEKIPIGNLLVIVDDLSLPFGTLRLKPGGSDAGHNGLININHVLGHDDYARLRFGIGSDFDKGRQVNYVLGSWTEVEEEILPQKIDIAIETIRNFGRIGIQKTMNLLNTKIKEQDE